MDFSARKEGMGHLTLRHLLNNIDTKSTKSLAADDLNLNVECNCQIEIPRPEIPDAIISGLNINEYALNQIFCEQLGTKLCWKCSRELDAQKLRKEVHSRLLTTDPITLPRLICVENILRTMNLPLPTPAEVNQWKTEKIDFKDNSLDSEPLFFPFYNYIPLSSSKESSNLNRYETNGERHVTFNTLYGDESPPSDRKSIQLIAPPVFKSNEI